MKLLRPLCCALVLAAMVLPASAARFVDVGTSLNIPSTNCAAWGDYDGDGYPDLFIGGIWGVHRAYLLHNNGNGTFTDVTVAMGLHIDSASWEDVQGLWGDFNNDGRLDLLVVGGSTHLPFLYRNDGDHFTDVGGAAAGFSSKWYVGSGGAWGDYDGDNWLDLYVSNNYYGAPSFLYHNNRDGTFTEVTSAAGMDLAPATYAQGCAWVDYNNDGLLDLIVARNQQLSGDQQTPLIYLNNGDGTFTDMALSAGVPTSSLESATPGDYDNDGFFDIYFGGNQNRGTLLEHNNGDGTFTNVHDTAMTAGANSVGTAWADYDNDGWIDLAQGNGTLPTYNETFLTVAYLFHNKHDGEFDEVSTAEGITASRKFRAAAWADFNRDGRMDLLLGAADSYSCLYQNTGADTDGNWLRVRPLTSRTGDATDGSPVRDAIGARVDVNLDNDLSFPKGRTLARLIDGGSGFMGQNEPIAQFGLGTANTVAVRVVFPNHHIVVESGVTADQQIEIRDVHQGLGSVQGAVTDARNGHPVIGGTVTLSYLTAITNVSGSYRLPVVPAGTYSVTAAGPGFAPLTMNDVVVPSGAAVTVNFALNLPAPVADFSATPTSGVGPLTVSFTDASTGGPTAWAWDFGDGGTSSLQSPSHAYSKAGDYTVSLTASNAGGPNTKTKSKYISVLFTDVAADFYAYSQIMACVDAGIVSGYPGNSYRPSDPVTRDQMAVYIARALAGGDAKVPTNYATASFPDVDSSYYAFKYIEYAKAEGIVGGYPDGTYQPLNPVTRDQMAIYVARAMVNPPGEGGLASYIPPTTPSFPDVAADYYAYKYIEYIKSKSVTGGYPDGKYHPELTVTRDQMAIYITRAFGLM